jgi:hypothetical protein
MMHGIIAFGLAAVAVLEPVEAQVSGPIFLECSGTVSDRISKKYWVDSEEIVIDSGQLRTNTVFPNMPVTFDNYYVKGSLNINYGNETRVASTVVDRYTLKISQIYTLPPSIDYSYEGNCSVMQRKF